MFYNTRVEYYDKNKKISKYEYLFNLNSLDGIRKDILIPFKNNGQIIINGKFLEKADITRIQVTQSSLNTNGLINKVRQMYSGMAIAIGKEDVAFDKTLVSDITTDLLDEIINKNDCEVLDSIKNHLHAKIIEVSLQKFLDGYYSDSVETAIKEVNSKLKKMYKKFKNEELDGADLFAKVFSDDENKTLLKVADLNSLSGKDEQKGYRFLFMGMWFAMRNPKAHEKLSMTKDEAYDRLIFISMLMKKIDKAFSFTFEELD